MGRLEDSHLQATCCPYQPSSWAERWHSRAGLSSFSAGVRKYPNSQGMDRAPNITHWLEERLPMSATGKASEPRTLCCGMCLEQSDIVMVSGRKNSCVCFSPSHPLSPQHDSQQSNGGQRKELWWQLSPRVTGRNQERWPKAVRERLSLGSKHPRARP